MPKRKPTTHSLLYDLPRLYDILHLPGTEEEVDGLCAIAQKWSAPGVNPQGIWLEPACGSGRHLRSAARRGIRCIGTDLSPGMLKYARSKMNVRQRRFIRLVRADMGAMDGICKPGSVDFAFNTINTIRHLASDAALVRHFRSIAAALRPGAVYAVGLSLSCYGFETDTEDRWEGTEGATRIIQNVQYIPAPGSTDRAGRSERVISHLTVRRGKREEHHDDAYLLRAYDLRQWIAILERSPLRLIATIDEYGEPIAPAEPGYTLFALTHKNDPRAVKSVWHGAGAVRE